MLDAEVAAGAPGAPRTIVVTPVDGAHECECAHLCEVVGALAVARKPTRDTVDEWQIRLDQPAPFELSRSGLSRHNSIVRGARKKGKTFIKIFFG